MAYGDIPGYPSCPVPEGPSVDHILATPSLVISATIAYLSTLSRLVGILDGLLVKVRRSYFAFRLLNWPKIWIFQVSPQGASLMRSYIVVNMGVSDPLWYLNIFWGMRPIESYPTGSKGIDRVS